MPLNPKLKELLVCPKCHGKLSVVGDDEALDCPACRLRYKIERYPNDVLIPNMIIEQAEDLSGQGQRSG
ncbi:MAG: hypothetical protein A2V67_16280 [Deltaproteobacteria bacterium RBG_13_61_14]|nr:MAG: hypothetical protein A2V67_16280 [Deltaproteobacteria bacterium RBG_13_61_14]